MLRELHPGPPCNNFTDTFTTWREGFKHNRISRWPVPSRQSKWSELLHAHPLVYIHTPLPDSRLATPFLSSPDLLTWKHRTTFSGKAVTPASAFCSRSGVFQKGETDRKCEFSKFKLLHVYAILLINWRASFLLALGVAAFERTSEQIWMESFTWFIFSLRSLYVIIIGSSVGNRDWRRRGYCIRPPQGSRRAGAHRLFFSCLGGPSRPESPALLPVPAKGDSLGRRLAGIYYKLCSVSLLFCSSKYYLWKLEVCIKLGTGVIYGFLDIKNSVMNLR